MCALERYQEYLQALRRDEELGEANQVSRVRHAGSVVTLIHVGPEHLTFAFVHTYLLRCCGLHIIWLLFMLGVISFGSHVLLRLPLSSETACPWPDVCCLVNMYRSQCWMALRSYGRLLISGSAWFANICWKSECSAQRQWSTTSSGRTITTPSPSARFCGRCKRCDAPNDFFQASACVTHASFDGR